MPAALRGPEIWSVLSLNMTPGESRAITSIEVKFAAKTYAKLCAGKERSAKPGQYTAKYCGGRVREALTPCH